MQVRRGPVTRTHQHGQQSNYRQFVQWITEQWHSRHSTLQIANECGVDQATVESVLRRVKQVGGVRQETAKSQAIHSTEQTLKPKPKPGLAKRLTASRDRMFQCLWKFHDRLKQHDARGRARTLEKQLLEAAKWYAEELADALIACGLVIDE